MASYYCRFTGVVLLVLAALGVLQFGIPGVMSFSEPGEIGLHLVLGIVSCAAGFGGGAYGARIYARIFSIAYVAIGALGFVVADFGVVHLDVACNFVHLCLGLWGLWAGYFADSPDTMPHTAGHAA